MPGEDPHDIALAEAVKAWCDAEIQADPEYASGTIVGEWYMVVSRSGFTAEGEPIAQYLDTSAGSATRLMGLLRLSQLKLERYLMED